MQTIDEPDFASMLAGRPGLSMHASGGLVLDDVPLAVIAAAVGTPTWVMSAQVLRDRFGYLADAFGPLGARIHYAVKANDHLAVLDVLARAGAGADVVSGGELRRAMTAGIDPAHIVFSGVGKSVAEMQDAVAAGLSQVNVESAEELSSLSTVAAGMDRTVRVALRVNPDVDAGTHAKITTGRLDNKFGVALADIPGLYARAATLPGVQPIGLALHIGSQIAAMAPYGAAYARAADMIRQLRAAGHAVQTMDCGGGLGIRYRDEAEGSPAAWAGAVAAAFGGMDLRLMIEPGRWLAGPAGLLLARTMLTKVTAGHRFVVLDAAMNDLVRPAMYDSWHAIVPLSPGTFYSPRVRTDVVGPVCETGDTFARGRLLPALAAGDCVAILDTGAYGSSMSSTYNARPLAAIAMVDGARWSVIRPRQAVDALWEHETVPRWPAADRPAA